jgi:isoquinoline 1-oxidoreductase subunit beta
MSLAELDRRQVMRGTAALILGLQAPIFAGRAAGQTAAAMLTAWVRVSSDNRVTLFLSQVEMGQGISTTLPAILADELGAEWSRIEVEHAPIAQKDISPYQNPRIHFMFTGNSESTATFSPLMRKAGAAAREMLIAAAIKQWRGAAEADCTTEAGKVIHRPTRRSLSFGALAADAAKLPVPENPRVRPTAELRLIGRSLPRRDIPEKTDGSAVFGLDFRVPGMVYAAVRQARSFGGSVIRFDPASVANRPGVIGAFAIPNGVAVVADHFWQAKTALDALDVTFAPGPNAAVDMESITAQYRAALDGTSFGTITNRGDAATAVAGAARKVEAEYWSSFQAHATMEPMNCTASVTGDDCDIWAPTQGVELTRIVAGAVTKLPPEKIRVHWTYAGGGFGRRLLADFVAQALMLSKAVKRPVKVVWTREEDMTHDFYRPATLTRITAALDAQGAPTAINARLVSATQIAPVSPAPPPANVDPRCTEGLEDSRYAIANFRLDYNKPTLAVPTSVLRTTGFGPNIFALESFIDELAHAAGADPYRFRRDMLQHDARSLKVLDLAAEKCGWGTPLPKGSGRGIAFYEAFDTVMAQVVELEVDAQRAVRVRRIVTVADPGRLFDRGIAASNLQGGAVWGLTSAMKSEITFANGGVVQENFGDYDVVHMWEAPGMNDVYLLEGPADQTAGGAQVIKTGGIGEVGPTGIPPALANAVFAVTGERVRTLPLSRHGYSFAQV